MYKNVVVKRALKGTIFRAMSVINRVIPKCDKIILLYTANGGMWSNLKALKRYLLDYGYDKKYTIYCGIENMKYAESDTNRVTYCAKIKSILIFYRAKHVFYTSGQIPIKPSSTQIVIHLDHGAANFKKCGALTSINNGDEFYFTYYLAPSKVYIPIVIKEYKCKECNIRICGEACTDVMYGDYERYNLGEYSKIILWTPTFRQSDYYGYNDSEESILPMYSDEEYEELNQKLKDYNFRLIVKLHPGQDAPKSGLARFSNLSIYSDEEFSKNGYELYSMMVQVDYMIADYSSVFLQFLLLDKPVAFVIPDFDEYSRNRGFVFENPKDYMPGEHITCKAELYSLFATWGREEDIYGDQRKKVRDIIHFYQDGNNAKRAAELSQICI